MVAVSSSEASRHFQSFECAGADHGQAKECHHSMGGARGLSQEGDQIPGRDSRQSSRVREQVRRLAEKARPAAGLCAQHSHARRDWRARRRLPVQ